MSVKVDFVDTKQDVMCPYCLHVNKLERFLLSTKKGYHRSQAKCPNCSNGCMIKTLLIKMTPEQYAEFAYAGSGYGFWRKISWYEWKQQLTLLGWAGKFWKRYKALKSEGATGNVDSYEAELNRRAEEAWKEYESEVKEDGKETEVHL